MVLTLGTVSILVITAPRLLQGRHKVVMWPCILLGDNFDII